MHILDIHIYSMRYIKQDGKPIYKPSALLYLLNNRVFIK